VAATAYFTRWNTIEDEPLLATDAQGYYAYLPAAFVYHDLQFGFVDSVAGRYYDDDKKAVFVISTEKGNVNKYFIGTALLEAPWFVVGHGLAKWKDQPTDGYSRPYQWAIGIGAVLYLAFGALFLLQLLAGLGFTLVTRTLTVLSVVFGTNLFYYTVYEPGMSHVYSFFTVSGFLWFAWRAFDGTKAKDWVATAAFLALTVLIRPTNLMVVMALPALFGGFGTLGGLERLFGNWKVALVAVLVFVVVVALQPVVYMVQTGSPMVWSYGEEGFNFLSPEWYNVLFSYRKGLFVYTPIMFLAFVGMVVGLFRRKVPYGWLVGYAVISTWVIASWWMWYYGGSFGHRAFIDHYPVYAIGLACLLQRGVGFVSAWVFRLALVPLVALQLFQTVQYVEHIIPFDNMDRTKYWNMFLQRGDDLAWYYSPYAGQDSYVGLDSAMVGHDMEQPWGWGNEQQLTNELAHQGTQCARMAPEDQYGITLRTLVKDVNVKANAVRMKAWVRSDRCDTDLSMVCSLEDSTGAGYYWRKHPLRPQLTGKNEWSEVRALFKVGEARHPSDKYVIYLMKSDGATVVVDELEVGFIHAR